MAELDTQLEALNDIVESAKAAIAEANDNRALDNVRVEFLGKDGQNKA